MPRANRYFVPGKLYHLTHRCYNRQFLFKFCSGLRGQHINAAKEQATRDRRRDVHIHGEPGPDLSKLLRHWRLMPL